MGESIFIKSPIYIRSGGLQKYISVESKLEVCADFKINKALRF